MDFILDSEEEKYSENFQKLLALEDGDEVIFQSKGLTQQRLRAQIDPLRNLISFWREYPDLFIDMIKGEDCKFTFLHYQRHFLRAVMRHRYVYATFPRA